MTPAIETEHCSLSYYRDWREFYKLGIHKSLPVKEKWSLPANHMSTYLEYNTFSDGISFLSRI